jgi:NTE family protein
MKPGMALCLSGGGNRAMLFHIGALWRLNELKLLSQLKRVSSVSGGSITAATLAIKWNELRFVDGVATAFEEKVVAPIRKFASKTIDVPAVIKSGFGILSPGHRVAAYYRKHLFGNKTLQDLPDVPAPLFVINATNVQSGVLWRFTKPFIWDYRVGKIPNPKVELAIAVAASSAFPPSLSPLVLKFKETDFEPNTGKDLQRPPYTTRVYLTDGGVYDNLGLETAKDFETILVSDGGAEMVPIESPQKNWLVHAKRVLEVIDNQVGALRRRHLLEAYRSGQTKGAYWGIGSQIVSYGTPGTLPFNQEDASSAASVPTRLKALSNSTQCLLINWGYWVCDAAIRKHVDTTLPKPRKFPYP